MSYVSMSSYTFEVMYLFNKKVRVSNQSMDAKSSRPKFEIIVLGDFGDHMQGHTSSCENEVVCETELSRALQQGLYHNKIMS